MVSRKKVLIYDSSKCTGCRSCMAGCSLQHEGECSKILSRIHIVKKEESGDNYISGCNQCEDPICAAVCHFGANKIDREKGIAVIDSNVCTGCKECVTYCPFGAANFNPRTGKAFKCDLCDGDPVCTRWCPSGAITYDYPDISLKKKRRDLQITQGKMLVEAAKEV